MDSNRHPDSRASARRLLLATSLVVAVPLLMAGCIKDVEQRGNLPKPEQLSQLAPGEQTREDVRNLLGTPSTTAVFDGDTWYYISAHTTQYAFYPNHEFDRTIFAVSFDEHGILKEVRKLDIDDGRNVTIATRETPTKGREYSFFEQLVGNLGRISTGAGPKHP